ncbi:MAG: hypothetical protein U0800_20250 [Isosphaeraceae bacterium]
MGVRPRFTLAGLLGAIVLCGIGFAALRTPSPLWANLMFTAAVISLMVAAINVAFARGGRRRFWAGFAICGGAYFAMCFVPGLKEDMLLRLATTPVLEWLYERTIAEETSANPNPIQVQGLAYDLALVTQSGSFTLGPPPQGIRLWNSPTNSPTTVARWMAVDPSDGAGLMLGNLSLNSSMSYRRVGHSLFCLLFGLVGGVLTRRAFDDPAPNPEASA